MSCLIFLKNFHGRLFVTKVKNIGKKHKWIDRLVWTETKWIDYVSNQNVKTYVFKFKDDLAGFFELISHGEKKEVEIAYFGLLEEFQNKKSLLKVVALFKLGN